ncbi:MAG: TIGR03960 family B12-binding radical SAM protein [Bacillota bacterium]
MARFERILNKVTKPARYTGGEWNEVRKDHDAVEVLFALAFPDVYEVGMSHLGLRLLYHELNRRPDTAAERVFSPWVDMEKTMREEGLPLFALESKRPVGEFDFVGVTLQYEMSFTNILNLLDLSGIPLLAAERGPDDPFVIAGGPCAFNPEPVADFFDHIVWGEGEEVIHDLVQAYLEWRGPRRHGGRRARRAGANGAGAAEDGREGFLLRAAAIPGVYIPAFYDIAYQPDGRLESIRPNRPGVPEVVHKRVVRDLDTLDYPTDPIVPFLDIVHDRIMVEVFRGCTRGCRFCQAGVIYRPVRERSSKKVKGLAADLVRKTGYNEISLTSLSSGDYSTIAGTLRDLIAEHGPAGVGVSLPSLRVDSFDVALAEEVQKVRKTGLTFAPEAGTQRLRDVINKNVTEEDLMRTARAAFSSGWNALKLYFMIGLPTETDEDVLGIVDLAEKISRVYFEAGRQGGPHGHRRPLRLTVSTSSFVPKAHTPFQWEPQTPMDGLRQKQDLLRHRLPRRLAEYNWHDAEVSFIEGVFARGDRRLGRALLEAHRRGCRFDAWSDQFRFEAWMESFAATGLDPAFYANRPRADDEVLPWDHLSSGVAREFLIEEHRKAMAGETTTDCRAEGCTLCEVCPSLEVDLDLKGGGDAVADQG